MDSRHIIEEAVFDISFDSTQAAHEQESGIATFIQARLLPLADVIFGEIAADGMDTRIDLLEIDLGDIGYRGFMEEMASRFEERLRIALQGKLQSSQASSSATEEKISRARSERERLQRFLETGRMTWRDGPTAPALDAMLRQAMSGDGAEFAAFLRNTPDRAAVIRRLVSQFSESCLADLTLLLAPARETRVTARIAELWRAWKGQFMEVTESEFRTLLWESLIDEHLVSGTRGQKALFDDAARRVFVRYVTSTQARHPYVAPAGAGNATAASQDGTDESQYEPSLLRAHLDSALAEGLAGNLGGRWEAIKARHPHLIRESCAHWLAEENARAKVAQGFPEPMLLDIVHLFAPAESSLVKALADALRSEEPGKANGRNTLLWEHTLHHLGTAAAFDRRTYARTLLRQLAAAPEAQGAARSALTAVAPQLAAELTTEAATEAATTNREAATIAVLSAEQARQRIKARFLHTHGSLDNDFWRAIEAHAARAADTQRYYRRVLDDLLQERTVNLEVAADAPRGMPHPTEEPGTVGSSRTEVVHHTFGARLPERPKRAGAKDGAKDGGDAGTFAKVPGPIRPTFVLAGSPRHADDAVAAEIHIANAGLVLLAPFMPRLFRMLELTDGQQFKSEMAAERAIHLLQFAVNESCDSPEFLLPLNKMLCGVAEGIPIGRGVEMQPKEKETIEGMLRAVIQQWSIIGNTSVEGLRESFLQRAGRLRSNAEGWKLKVETKGIDVLLDRLPWSFAIIKHPWMTRPVHVEWR